MKRIAALAVTAVILAAPAASAQDAVADHVGMIGFGYFTSDAPVGVRYWTGPSLGFDVGIGFRTENQVPIDENGTPDTTSLMNFALEAGVLVPLASGENMVLFVRPGIAFTSEGEVVGAAGAQKKESATTFSVSAMIGAELFMTKFGFPNLSFGGGHGLVFTSASPAGEGDSVTTIGSAVAEVSIVNSSSVGFHFYF